MAPSDQGPLDPAPHASATDTQVPEARLLDRDFGKFVEKRRHEAEAAAVESDGARLVFGAGLPRRDAEPEPKDDVLWEEEAARPAGIPAKVGETLKLIDIATGDAPPPAVVAESPERPRAAGPSAASAPRRAPAPSAPAPKPVAAVAAKEAVSPRSLTAKSRPVVPVADEASLELPRLRALPARPVGEAGADELAPRLAAVRQALSVLLAEQSHRLLELKVASAEGIARSIANLESEARHFEGYLARGAALTGEAAETAAAARAQEDVQDQLEARVVEIGQRARTLAARVEELHGALARLDGAHGKLETDVASRGETLERARSEVDRLAERLVSLEREEQALEAVRSRLAESVERLERLMGEREAAIVRLSESKDLLTKHV